MNNHPTNIIASRRAFTIIEILVCISVVSVVLAITLPALGRVREITNEQLCVSRIRSSTHAIIQYTMDSRGTMPFGGIDRREIATPYGGTTDVGGVRGLNDGRWAILLTEYWEGDQWSEGMRCPDQPAFDPDALLWDEPGFSVAHDGYLREPWYWLSSAFHLTPESLRRESFGYEDFRVRAQKIHSVQYPSMKSVLFESVGFCIPKTTESYAWIDLAQTQLLPTSLSTVDGSCIRYARRNAFRPSIGLGCDFTMDGVRGRDVDRALENKDAYARLSGRSWGEPDPVP